MLPLILVIDDNQEILDLVEEIFSTTYSVVKATNAPDALALLDSTSVQLIISDVMMPDMDGFAFCHKIKSTFDYCHIPLILLTAKKDLTSRIEGLELGADAYIDKPFSPRHLKAQAANLLKSRNALKDFFASSPLVHIKTLAIAKADELFLEELNHIILENLDNPQLDGYYLANALNMSRPSLYRKLKVISNLTVNELTNLARLKKAAELLAEGVYRIYEISNLTGFSSPNHFNRVFYKQFGITPSNFAKMHMEKKDGG